MRPPPEALAALLDGNHADPFALLGPHEGPEGTFARAILHGAEEAEAFSLKGGKLGTMTRVDSAVFEGKLRGKPKPIRYRCRGYGNEWWVTDPYSFGPVFGPMDDFLIAEGTHLRPYELLGARLHGFRAAWLNERQLPWQSLQLLPDVELATLDELAGLLL